MADTDTKRWLLVVFGGILVALVVLSGFISVVSWHADLYATEGNVGSDAAVRAGDLSDECRHFAQSLAASRNVSLREYRVGLGPMDVLLRRTPAEGWGVGDTACSTQLAFQNNLRVEERSYNVEGHYTRSAVHRKPLFRTGQLLGGVAGLGMLFVGYRGIRNSDAE